MKNHYDVIIIGGGAAGIFSSIIIKENNPNLSVLVLEAGKNPLAKVRISGGGRCNLTNAEFKLKEFVRQYPRGQKELLGPFHEFDATGIVQFFNERGVETKIEPDGRIFPKSDLSETIIRCFMDEVKRLKIEIKTSEKVNQIKHDSGFNIIANQSNYTANKIILCTGGGQKGMEMAKEIGHMTLPGIPSLFSFENCTHRLTHPH